MQDNELRELIMNNQNLIYSIIHKFRSKDYDDLFQVGCLGLVKAIDNFDISYDVKLSTYACPIVFD